MTKSRVVTTTEREEVEEQKISGYYNPYIRAWLMVELPDDVFEEILQPLSFNIWVQRITSDGKKQRVARTYSDLKTLGDDLGAAFGEAHFRLMINYTTADNKRGFFREENFETVDEDEREPEPASPAADATLQMMMLKEAQAHEIRLKEMENNRLEKIAIINSKGGGGLKPSDMMDLIRLGRDIAEGNITAGETGETGEDSEPGWMNDIKKMVLPLIAQKLMQGGGPEPVKPVTEPTNGKAVE